MRRAAAAADHARPRRLARQLVIGFTPIAIGAVAVACVVTYRSAAHLLTAQAHRHVAWLGSSRAQALERYFHALETQVVATARDPSTVLALKDLTAATWELEADSLTAPSLMRPRMERLKSFLEAYYAAELADGGIALPSLLLPQRSSVWLQAAYVARRPDAEGPRPALVTDDPSRYGKRHAVWDPPLRDLAERFDFSDLYLVDAASGRIVYTVGKRPDFQTSLLDGPYARSGLGDLFRHLQVASQANAYQVSDFSPHLPLHRQPVMFAGATIADGAEVAGMLIAQVPATSIDRMLHDGDLARGAETFAVGRADLLMRNTSRFISEAGGWNPSVAGAGTTVLRQLVGIDAITAGVPGRRYVNYRGVPVLGHAAALTAHGGLDWVVVTELEEAEALHPIARLRERTLVVAAVLIAAVFLATVRLSTAATAPLQSIRSVLRKIDKGDRAARAHVTARNEISDIARFLNRLLDDSERPSGRSTNGHERDGDLHNVMAVLSNALEGDLTRRARVSSRSMQELADALNALLDHLMAQFGQFMHSLSCLRTSAVQVHTSVHQLSHDAAAQAREMTEAAATFQTTAAVPSSADGIPRREATTRLHETVQHAAQSVGRVADTATTLQTDTRNLAGKTKLLTERSMEVSTAVTGLHEVAAAANVLALNATIEASKIPTQGQGFTEITADLRRLADRAGSAVATLAQLAASVQSDAAEAVRGIERQSQLVDRQLTLVADAHAALEQALGATADEVAAPSETAGAPAKRARAIHQALVYASEVMRRIHGASEHSLTRTAALLATVSELQAVLGRFHTTHEPSAQISASLVEIESDAAGANGRRS